MERKNSTPVVVEGWEVKIFDANVEYHHPAAHAGDEEEEEEEEQRQEEDWDEYDAYERELEEIEMMKKDLIRSLRTCVSKLSGDVGYQIGIWSIGSILTLIGYTFHRRFPYHINRPKVQEKDFFRWVLTFFADSIIS
eukprot:jgi/Bigna1/143699/aug1.80_g18407